MERSEIENVLKEAVKSCADAQGWANLAEIGAHLRLQDLRYGKLSRFLRDFSDIIETRIDDAVTPPAVYAKIIE